MFHESVGPMDPANAAGRKRFLMNSAWYPNVNELFGEVIETAGYRADSATPIWADWAAAWRSAWRTSGRRRINSIGTPAVTSAGAVGMGAGPILSCKSSGGMPS